MEVLQAAFSFVRAEVQATAALLQNVAFEVKTETNEFLRTGMGVPRAISSAASFSCFAVAAAGTANLTFDLIGKAYGPRECEGCNGWEGLACQTCKGIGEVQFGVRTPGLRLSEARDPKEAASAVLSGRADLFHLPQDVNLGMALPCKECPTCDGSGVMKCTTCKGDAWKNKISFDKMFDAPWTAWHVYWKQRRVDLAEEAMMDPGFARFMLLRRPEIHGLKMTEDEKRRIWFEYEKSQQYNRIRQVVAQRAPGWEAAQQSLVELNPRRALSDPVYVHNVALYRAVQECEAEVAKMQAPPRPPGWEVEVPDLLPALEWSKVADAGNKAEWEEVFHNQEKLKEAVKDGEWTKQWRAQKVEEVLREKATKVRAERERAQMAIDAGEEAQPAADSTPPAASSGSGKKAAASGKKPTVAGDNKKKQQEGSSKRAAMGGARTR
eukprot:TRINITY_DN16980_c0_g1_i1.p1 TRINITY_DN16980_c0_g1~~TRINITY_DN16980_c0_g1_i1.p1  ORF type:complete len:438 (-),score=108.83 TRINITY_DN16980_c0_g1_i1:298-1611(-)